MSKIERYAGNLRAFGSNAQGLERTLFGETTQADDLTSQVTAAFLRGWGIVGPSENPSLEDFNAAMYAMSQFIAYQHQMGIPEWDAAQEYYKGSLCVRGGETYSSLVNDNIGSAPPSAKWTPVLTLKNALANLGFEQSVAATGYQILPGGLIFQWGTATGDQGNLGAGYPVAFKERVFQVLLTLNDKTEGAVDGISLYATKDNFTNKTTLIVQNKGKDLLGVTTASYFAIGK